MRIDALSKSSYFLFIFFGGVGVEGGDGKVGCTQTLQYRINHSTDIFIYGIPLVTMSELEQVNELYINGPQLPLHP